MWPRLIKVSQKMSVFHWVHYLFLHSPAVAHGSKGVKVHLPVEKPPSFFAVPQGKLHCGVSCPLAALSQQPLLALPV